MRKYYDFNCEEDINYIIYYMRGFNLQTMSKWQILGLLNSIGIECVNFDADKLKKIHKKRKIEQDKCI